MSFLRTVLGDIPRGMTGVVYAHEHVAICGETIEHNFADFVLDDIEKISQEVGALRQVGVSTMIDAMPTDSGRSATRLVCISEKTGMNIVASTGLHLRMYYPAEHWFDTISEDALIGKMVSEIQEGMIDEGQASTSRAGVIKVAGSLGRLSDLEQRNFRAAAQVQRATGVPILTHTEQGTAAMEQIKILEESGADLHHVVLSHLDRIADLDYHREALSTGVRLEYDSAFRWKDGPNQTLSLILALAQEYPDQIVIGMDAARFSYWKSFGGKPGLSWLKTHFESQLLAAGLAPELMSKIWTDNPANAYSFITPSETPE